MPFNRDYLCLACGRIRRAPGRTPDGSLPVPRCCGSPMRELEYEGAVAAKKLKPAKRAAWFLAGAHFVARGRKRQWAPVTAASRCHVCSRRKLKLR